MRYVNDVKIYIENRLSRDVKLTAIYIIKLLNVCLFLSILIYSTLINIAFRCLFQLMTPFFSLSTYDYVSILL